MNFGAFVADRENDVVGTVERVVLDLTTNEVVEYVVHKTLKGERDVVVPMSAVSEMNDELVLNLNSSDVEKLPDYINRITRDVRAALQGVAALVPPETIEVSNKTRVEGIDGEIGTLEGVIIDEFTAEATDLIVRLKKPAGSATIPMAWASSVRSDVIRLQCARGDI